MIKILKLSEITFKYKSKKTFCYFKKLIKKSNDGNLIRLDHKELYEIIRHTLNRCS